MKIYTLQSYGYYACPEFRDLETAREYLRTEVAESLRKARRLSDEATKHKAGTDNYCITLGRDRNSTLYANHCIKTT